MANSLYWLDGEVYLFMIKKGNGLLPLNLLVIVLIVVVFFFPDNVLRFILGIPFVLFCPGYALAAALFPRKERLDGIERVAYSFGLSLAVVPLITMILNYTAWGIRLEPVLYCDASFTFIASAIAWVRWTRMPSEERFSISFNPASLRWSGGTWKKPLPIILVIVIVAGLGTVGYMAANPKVGERYTEFYISGTEGTALDYPKELVAGERGRVIVSIVNHEKEEVSYRLEVTIDGRKNAEVRPIVLEDEQKWEETISFTLTNVGENQKVEFWLYKNGESEPVMEPLFLWLNVKQ